MLCALGDADGFDLIYNAGINFYGQYEWNPKGGVIHWTHHDPNGQHEGGWLNHGGKIYQ
ncbi:DUF3465 domain-containing protein [Desulfobacter latus]|uniref:DUF3465 domain-containing protein n=1 Tax=Desulfobacter latus TaxID=2292 RepID=A0A850SZN3_9BACT|nr:DUF3465 domain-containing protein [Desulfobacter latus]